MRANVIENIIKINVEELNKMIDKYIEDNGIYPYIIMNAYTNNYIAKDYAKLIPDKLKEEADIEDWMEMFPKGYLRRYKGYTVLHDGQLPCGAVEVR